MYIFIIQDTAPLTCRYDEKFNGFVEHRLSYLLLYYNMGFPGSSAGKETACNARDPGLIPGLRRFPWRRDRLPTPEFLGFPGGSDGKESACNERDLGSIPRWEDPLEKETATRRPVLWPGEFHGQRSLVGYRPWGPKELDATEQLSLSYYGIP